MTQGDNMNVLLLATGNPANSGGNIRIGDGPPLTTEQLRDILIVAGHPSPEMASRWLSRGTTCQPIVQRTAADFVNEGEVSALREHRDTLLRALRTKLTPLWLRVLDALIDWHFVSTLSAELGISVQQVGNVCSGLSAIGLLERMDSPTHLRGRSPYLYRAVAAVAGELRLQRDLSAIELDETYAQLAARRLQQQSLLTLATEETT